MGHSAITAGVVHYRLAVAWEVMEPPLSVPCRKAEARYKG